MAAMIEEDDDSDGDGGINLTGFLFGNIDDEGNLEDNDILDEESKRHLGQLASLTGGLSTLSDDLSLDRNDSVSGSTSSGSNEVHKLQSAVDFSDIDELAEDIKSSSNTISIPGSSKDDFQFKRPAPVHHSSMSMALPSVAPKAETSDELSGGRDVSELFQPSSPSDLSPEFFPGESEQAETPNDDINQELNEMDTSGDNVDAASQPTKELKVTDLFPEFRVGKILRFSRLFGPQKYISAQWKGLKKKKKKKRQLSIDQDKKPLNIQEDIQSEPLPEDIASDDEEKFMKPLPLSAYGDHYSHILHNEDDTTKQDEQKPTSCAWRHGPASYWYDFYNVKEDGTGFDYGFKLKQNKDDKNPNDCEIALPNDLFNMIVQSSWEDDIVWSSDQYKKPARASLALQQAGWIPSGNTRTMEAYLRQVAESKDKTSYEYITSKEMLKNFTHGVHPKLNSDPNTHKLSDWYSVFPVDNEKLVYEKWEDKIIWDSQAMDKIPSPVTFELDPNDENLIIGIPNDTNPNQSDLGSMPKKESKSKSRFMVKPKLDDKSDYESNPQLARKDPFNLSNDEFYMPKQDLAENQLQADLSSLTVQHSTPAMELQRPFFPTYLSPSDLRHFHRPPLPKKRVNTSNVAVQSLAKNMRKKAKEREKERRAFGGGEVFLMRQISDLSGMDSEVVLMEYCEEYPPLLSQVGMNAKIKNYYKRKHGKDSGAPTAEFGEVVYAHHSPFLGQLVPGQLLQALESNLFRAPIYEHKTNTTDFLVILTKQGYHVRKIPSIFVVGQECPKTEVPGPNSKRANNHIRDFLQIFIYRLFWKSHDNPRRIKMEDIRHAFPKHSESSVRKRLKLCADFKRTGVDCNWWVLKTEFRLPTEEEMRAMVTAEQTCAYYSMLAAEQRLKDAGYGEKSLFAPDDDDNEVDARKIDDEIQTAPWNTTRAFIQTMKGKCLLQVTGVADPTGCGEGFSYIRVPNKPVTGKEDQKEADKQKKQKLVTGTDADLRRLNLKQAKILLREFGVSEEEIKKLSRWEVIDKVRTLSTEAARSGEEGGLSKFARGSRFTVAEHQGRYKEECQRIFDLQNRLLSSETVLSTDEESSGEEGSDLDELGKDLESMLSSKKSSVELSREREEQERKELQKLLMNDPDKSNRSSVKKQEEDDAGSVMSLDVSSAGRRLLIHRTFTEAGQEYNRTEVVKNQSVIDAYLRIVTRDPNYRQVFASQDEKHKEDMRRERRRIQEQLRRIKRNQAKEKFKEVKKVPKPIPEKPLKNLKCGACGEMGHMKTNKMCPKYQEIGGLLGVQVAMTDEEFVTEEMSNLGQDDLIKVEGTKIVLGKALLEATQDLKRKSLTIRIPKDTCIRKRRRSSAAASQADYLVRHHKAKHRRRTNPLVAMSLLLEEAVMKMKEFPESWAFLTPVAAKNAPDYHNIVKEPMDLQTIKENVKAAQYHTHNEFLEHVTLIFKNCVLYNGVNHPLSKNAEDLVTVCKNQLEKQKAEIEQLEKEINPLLDGDRQVGFSWLLETIVSQVKSIPESWPFHQPVSSKMVPDYHTVIKNPMDLESIKLKCQDHRYQRREALVEDFKTIAGNSLLYNGPDHQFTKVANRMIERCRELLKENEERLSQLQQEGLHDLHDSALSDSILPSDYDPETSVDGYDFSTQSALHLRHGPDGTVVEQRNIKQRIVRGSEDEEVDVEGTTGPEELHTVNEDQLDQMGALDDSMVDVSLWSGSTDLQGHSFGITDDTDDLGLLLLQDLETSPLHSDASDDDDLGSDNDIPLDDGDDDEDFDAAMEDETNNFEDETATFEDEFQDVDETPSDDKEMTSSDIELKD